MGFIKRSEVSKVEKVSSTDKEYKDFTKEAEDKSSEINEEECDCNCDKNERDNCK